LEPHSNTTGTGTAFGQKIKDYQALVKFRLALSVVFSACTAYVLGTDSFSWQELCLLGLGGLFVTGSANTLNQVLEKETDKLMSRTQNRPLPAGRMEMSEAVLFAGLMGAAGILMLAYFNPLTAVLGAFSLVSYAFIYTPMKKVSPAAVWIGAVPGALPMAIGWVAATPNGALTTEAVFLFSLQFLWQFPHFWAIAWLVYEDYAKAGFYLLPSSQKDGRNKSTAVQVIFYVLCLIALSFVPFYLSISGLVACTIMLVSGLVFLWFAMRLYWKCDAKAAKQLMFSSLIYQVIVFIALMADKI
jgi:protoheme IX farnesyltransferase